VEELPWNSWRGRHSRAWPRSRQYRRTSCIPWPLPSTSSSVHWSSSSCSSSPEREPVFPASSAPAGGMPFFPHRLEPISSRNSRQVSPSASSSRPSH